MRVLLTGDAGYIGSVMGGVLRAAGHEVLGVDAGYFTGCDLQAAINGEVPVESRRMDIRDLTVDDLYGFEAVIHLAGLCNDPLGDLNPAWTYEINHRATVSLAANARRAGVERFLFASSCSVYGEGIDHELTETATPHPLTAYAASKARAEADVAMLADDGFSPVFLRNASVYGASPRFRADIVLNNLVCWVSTGRNVKLLSDGSPWRPLVHVEDVAQAFALALVAPPDAIHNQVFNLGVPGGNYQIRELAELVSGLVPGSIVERKPDAPPDARDYRVCFDKLQAGLPEFRPGWTIERGARQMFDAVRSARLTLEDFQGPRYTRLTRLRQLIESGSVDDALRVRPLALPVPA